MLSNPNFLKKAPENKIIEEKNKLEDYNNNLKEARIRLIELKG